MDRSEEWFKLKWSVKPQNELDDELLRLTGVKFQSVLVDVQSFVYAFISLVLIQINIKLWF